MVLLLGGHVSFREGMFPTDSVIPQQFKGWPVWAFSVSSAEKGRVCFYTNKHPTGSKSHPWKPANYPFPKPFPQLVKVISRSSSGNQISLTLLKQSFQASNVYIII